MFVPWARRWMRLRIAWSISRPRSRRSISAWKFRGGVGAGIPDSGYGRNRRQPARLERSPGPQSRRCGLPDLAARAGSTEQHRRWAALARCFHRSLLSARRRVQRRRVERDAVEAQSVDRSLWDPNYVDETWINDRVQLIPRIRELGEHVLSRHARRDARYTGRRNHINGATTQADVFWDLRPRRARHGGGGPASSTSPTYKAMKMYRNYERQQVDVRRHERGCHGTQSRRGFRIRRTASSDGALTVMVINKTALHEYGRDHQSLHLRPPWHRPGLAAHPQRTRSVGWLMRASPARGRSNSAGAERDALVVPTSAGATRPGHRRTCHHSIAVCRVGGMPVTPGATRRRSPQVAR